MIFSRDMLFLHVPKTGGMSVTSYLLEVLPRPVYYTSPETEEESESSNGIVELQGARHESLPEAAEVVRDHGMTLSSFSLILAGLRNPYDLEVSRYHYLRLGHPWDYGRNQVLALTRDFATFATESSFNEAYPIRGLEHYFFLEGRTPENLKVIRTENLEGDVRDALNSIGIEQTTSFPWKNRSPRSDFHSYYTKEAEEAVYRKYKWVFDRGFYPRMLALGKREQAGLPAGLRLTLPMIGAVRQKGAAEGFSRDLWIDHELKVTVEADEPIREVTLEGELPAALGGREVTLLLTLGSEQATKSLSGGEPFSWTVDCAIEPHRPTDLMLRSSATWCPKAAGISEDERRLVLLVKRLCFSPARGGASDPRVLQPVQPAVADSARMIS